MVFTRTKLRQISFIYNLSKHQPSSAKPSPVAQPSAAHPADHPANPTWSSGPAKAGLDFDCVEYLGLGIAKPSTFIEYVVFGFTNTLPFIKDLGSRVLQNISFGLRWRILHAKSEMFLRGRRFKPEPS